MPYYSYPSLVFGLLFSVALHAQSPPPPPPPLLRDTTPEEPLRVVEEMPRFPGCENMATKEEIKACSDKKLMEFIYKNLKYPEVVKDLCIEGIVVVNFVVEKDGSVSSPQIVRSVHPALDEEALRLIMLMQELNIKWTTRSRGRPQRVLFNLPVRFKLPE